jgi:hypothetical protein
MESHTNAIMFRSALAMLTAAAIVALRFAEPAAQTTSATGAGQQPTFTKDIAPIFQRACQECHRPGSIGPMPLMTYQDARPWARSVKDKVSRREMPPFFIDRSIGIQHFKDDPSLTDQEVRTIAMWVDAGAPQGNPADMPPPRTFDDQSKWQIGKPDLIVTVPNVYTVKAEQPDQWLDLYAESGLTEDRYIKAIEGKPTFPAGFRVVHHAHQYLIPPGAGIGGEMDGREETLNEYAVGKASDVFPEGSGRLIKAGTKIHFNVHYHAVGTEVKDQFSLGFVLYPKGYVPKHVLRTETTGNVSEALDIPAGASDVRVDGYRRFTTPVKLTSFQPHMHLRGKRECIEAIYPDGRTEMLNCALSNFGWALVYKYTDDAAPLLPAGTLLHVINWHDNSAANRANPDPRNWIGNGNRTIDEMSFSWVSWYDLSEDEYKQEVVARQRKLSNDQP